MKKSLLLFMLLPLLGIAQTDLVSWNTLSPTATSNVTSQNLATGGGVNVFMDQWNAAGIQAEQLHTNSNSISVNTSKYIEFTATPNSGYQLAASTFSFTYNSPADSGAKRIQAKASINNGSWITLTNAGGSAEITLLQNQNGIATFNFPANTIALENQNVRIRVYFYDLNNNYYSKLYIRTNAYGASIQGPTLTGSISTYSSVLNAVDDNYTVDINSSNNTLNVLANDVAGSTAINYLTLASVPSHGTGVVNGDNTITYTAAANYTGSDSFTYTIGNGTDSNDTATVNITVQGATPANALNGTYYIGTNGHFTTITAAVNHLNTYGVSGPVKFLLSNLLYNNASGETFPITINEFAGASSVNTVTFKPANSVNVKIEASNVNGWTGVPAVFKLDGADYVVFDGSNEINGTTRNLNITNKDNINYIQRAVIWIASNGSSDGATNNTIKYCNIRQKYKNSGSTFCTGIYSGNNQTGENNTMVIATANANNASLKVLGNDFMNVKQGIYINGGNGNKRATDVVIYQNDLGSENNTETIIQPAYLSNVDGFEYTENYIYNLYRNTNAGDLRSAGIHIANNTTNGYILKNTMRDLTRTTTDNYTFAGITLASTNNNANIVVANNTILNVAAQGNTTADENGHGINVNSGGDYKIYHNTVVLNTNQQNNGYSAALYIHSGVHGNLDIRNNIFVNNQTTGLRRAAILVNKSLNNINTVFDYLDYNNYYSNDKIGFISNSGNIDWSDNPDYQTTLSGWQSFTGKDASSINVNPVFVSASGVHLAATGNDNLNGFGTPLSAVTKDIDGQIRNTQTPDMGADEFGPIQLPEPGTTAGVYCDTSVTWTGTEWLGGEPTADKDVIFAGDFTQDGGTLYACAIFVTGGANVVFENDSNAIVTHVVDVADDASLTFESSSNLVQLENSQNSGIVTVKRNSSKIKRLDYTAWSSPVSGTQTLLDFSPLTLTNRFYILNTVENIYNTIPDPSTTVFEKAKGYLIRVSNNHSSTAPQIFEGEFEGTPNNGVIRYAMEYANNDDSYNLVGNPYPSPINVSKFIDENIDNIDGTLWVWRKTNDHTTTSYCTVNKTGFTANNAPGGGGNNGNNGNDLIGDPHAVKAGGVLNTGQGFFVRALNDQDLVFRNNMREAVNFDKFFRTEDIETEQEASNGNETNRYWINITDSEESAFSQMLIAHSTITTNGYENGYDGKSFQDSGVGIYTILNGETEEENINLTIQSRAAFTIDDVVRVGFRTDVAGSFTITLDHMDGIFEAGQEIYLIDKLNNSSYNLTNSDYTFNSEIGTFEDRFEIVYTIQALDTPMPEVAANELVVYQNGKELNVTAPQTIQSVMVYDLNGKVVYQNMKVDNNTFTTTLNIQQQVAIVMITLDNQQVVSKKIIVN